MSSRILLVIGAAVPDQTALPVFLMTPLRWGAGAIGFSAASLAARLARFC